MSDPVQHSPSWSTWLSWWTWVSLPGTALADTAWGWPHLVAAILCLAVLIATVSASQVLHDWQPDSGSVSHPLRSVVGCTTRLTLVVVAIPAVGSVSLPTLGVVLATLVATSPPARDTCRKLVAPPEHHPGCPVDDVGEAPGILAVLHLDEVRPATNDSLRAAWERSERDLRRVGSASELSYLLLLRRSYLEELECRRLIVLGLWAVVEEGQRLANSVGNDPPDPERDS